MAENEIIETLYAENKALIDYLESQKEYSFKTDIDNKFRKILLLSSASYFESKVIDILTSFVEKQTSQNEMIVSFLKNKAISRQYHTLFDWNSTNVNSFLGLFGEGFKTEVVNEIKTNSDLKEAASAFLELGNNRNRLVHQNFATFYMDKTSEEIFELYNKALGFINYLESKLPGQ